MPVINTSSSNPEAFPGTAHTVKASGSQTARNIAGTSSVTDNNSAKANSNYVTHTNTPTMGDEKTITILPHNVDKINHISVCSLLSSDPVVTKELKTKKNTYCNDCRLKYLSHINQRHQHFSHRETYPPEFDRLYDRSSAPVTIVDYNRPLYCAPTNKGKGSSSSKSTGSTIVSSLLTGITAGVVFYIAYKLAGFVIQRSCCGVCPNFFGRCCAPAQPRKLKVPEEEEFVQYGPYDIPVAYVAM